jgi:hypothetical protein
MNRCIAFGASCLKRSNLLVLGLVFSLAGTSAAAQSSHTEQEAAQGSGSMREQNLQPRVGVRQFPKDAKRATMQMQMPPEVLMNGKLERLSAGHRIHGMTNMQVMSGQIVGQALQVNYLRNAQGEIHEIWILSRRETQDDSESRREGSGPIRNFSFGSDAHKPVRDDGKTPFDKLPKYKN